MRNLVFPLLILVVALVFPMIGCGDPSTESPASALPETNSGVDWQRYHLTSEPADSQRIVTAKTDTVPGAAVTIHGRIGGRVEPFIAGQSALLLADSEHIVACDAMGSDHCATPWDFCCAASERRAEASALIQIVDESGAPYPHGLRGVNGLQPGDHVVIVGTVAPVASATNYIVHATGIYQRQ